MAEELSLSGGGTGGKRPGSDGAHAGAPADMPGAGRGDRRRKSTITLNEWPAKELTPPARRTLPLPPEPSPDEPTVELDAGKPGPARMPLGSGDDLLVTVDLGDWSGPTLPARDIAVSTSPTLDLGAPPISLDLDEPDLDSEPTGPRPRRAITQPYALFDDQPRPAPDLDSSGDMPTSELRMRPAPGQRDAFELDIDMGGLDSKAIQDSGQRDDEDDLARIERMLRAELDEVAPPGEDVTLRLKRRMTTLLERAQAEYIHGHYAEAVLALEIAVEEDPGSVVAQKLLQAHHATMREIYESVLGDLDSVPVLGVPLHELSPTALSPRAAFLLTRIDGMSTIDELLDVAGMPRLEALRYLALLNLRGIIKRG